MTKNKKQGDEMETFSEVLAVFCFVLQIEFLFAIKFLWPQKVIVRSLLFVLHLLIQIFKNKITLFSIFISSNYNKITFLYHFVGLLRSCFAVCFIDFVSSRFVYQFTIKYGGRK